MIVDTSVSVDYFTRATAASQWLADRIAAESSIIVPDVV